MTPAKHPCPMCGGPMIYDEEYGRLLCDGQQMVFQTVNCEFGEWLLAKVMA